MMCYSVDNKYYTATIHLYCERLSAEGAEAILLIINIGQVILETHSSTKRSVYCVPSRTTALMKQKRNGASYKQAVQLRFLY